MCEKKYYTYIILTQKDTLYCGYTDDVEKRFLAHSQGKGAKYTRAFKPKCIVYVKEFLSKSQAQQEEYRIKNLTTKDKKTLIQNTKLDNKYKNLQNVTL